MKILQIAPPWIDIPPENYGGTEWVIYNLIKGLEQLGHSVTLFATKTSTPPKQTKLRYAFKKSLVDMYLPWEAALPPLIHYYEAFKLADDFDIVHAHLSSQTDLMTLPFLADLTKRGIPSVLTIHGHHPFDRFSNFDRQYYRRYAKYISVINISKTMADLTPKPFKKAGVVYNSIDLSTIEYSPKGSYLTWIGKIISSKGLSDAIQIAKKTGEKLIFAGLVDEYQSHSMEYFEEKVLPYIDNKQIIYVGPADQKLKSELLGGAKAFLNPIHWVEPFGMVMIESMAAGTPVISYDRGAAPELIVNGKTGYLVETKKQMVNAVKKIDLITRIDCRNHVKENFTPRIAARQHIKIYHRIIEKISAKHGSKQAVGDW
jgi:glycosyltransferase involved in cell wall biosynthesis